MLFNSFHFLIFFVAVINIYYLLPQKYRWLLLLIASSYFYMVYNWRYIFILYAIIILDFTAAIFIGNTNNIFFKKILLAFSILCNIGILFYFKYFNFFIENTNNLIHFTTDSKNILMQLALPIGLSFHTFQALSYTIEVYRGKQMPEKHLGYYAVYVLYFPQLVAGPIERPQNILHQLRQPKKVNSTLFLEGISLMAIGYFKKIVIADQLSIYVNHIYNAPSSNILSFTMATLFFAIQIYCDFSGYTDIARGLSKTMGVELMLNFNYPYHAATVGEFWRRWHISLSTWFRDYVYMPLGGSNRSQVITYRNVLIVFLISGLWHGASWHYVAWGLLHGLVLLTERLANKYQLVLNKTWGSIKTFSIIIVSWSLFRINDLQDFKKISFHNLHISSEQFGWCYLIYALILIGIILFAEKKIVTSFLQLNNTKKVMAIIITTILIFIFGLFNNNQFIYFQF